ncbi:MAG: peptidoglycan-binding protein [Clostridia bacterium]|nr:peptidoglycan-binding protein [Clostridia bacterium]
MAELLPVVPEKITVHLGPSRDESAENVTVDFPDYVKNCASCEIYPTWPEEAIRANVYAIISFAMNRIYTEYYKNRDHDFDITNNTAEDQSYIRGHSYFDTISVVVDEIFNSYIRRTGNVEPLFAAYCNGTTSSCAGLSQWGTVSLAQNGYSALEILKYYYGGNIELVENAPVGGLEPAVPPMPLRIGIADDAVRFAELRLNRIGRNYPSIPKVSKVTVVFTQETEAAVREFQRIFGLQQNGTVDRSTWYKIQFVYTGVKRLNEIESEGLTLDEVSLQLPAALYPGDTGIYVSIAQYYLNAASLYYAEIPQLPVDGIYGPLTESAVYAVQQLFGLDQTGIIDRKTSFAIYDIYIGIAGSIADAEATAAVPFGGILLSVGSSGSEVEILQYYISVISTVYDTVAAPEINGVFGKTTEDAVSELQRIFGITVTGIVGPITWDAIANEYELISDAQKYNDGQYGGDIYESGASG